MVAKLATPIPDGPDQRERPGAGSGGHEGGHRPREARGGARKRRDDADAAKDHEPEIAHPRSPRRHDPDEHRADREDDEDPSHQDPLVVGAEVPDRERPQPLGRAVDRGLADGEHGRGGLTDEPDRDLADAERNGHHDETRDGFEHAIASGNR